MILIHTIGIWSLGGAEYLKSILKRHKTGKETYIIADNRLNTKNIESMLTNNTKILKMAPSSLLMYDQGEKELEPERDIHKWNTKLLEASCQETQNIYILPK